MTSEFGSALKFVGDSYFKLQWVVKSSLMRVGRWQDSFPNATPYLGYLLGTLTTLTAARDVRLSDITSIWHTAAAQQYGLPFSGEPTAGLNTAIRHLATDSEFLAGVVLGESVAAFHLYDSLHPRILAPLLNYYADTDVTIEDFTEIFSTRSDGDDQIEVPCPAWPSLKYVMPPTHNSIPRIDQNIWETDMPLIKQRVRKGFSDQADAKTWGMLNFDRRLFVFRPRGALVTLPNNSDGKWEVWLEPWEAYFKRPHKVRG